MSDFDVIVVGGGPAGATVATYMALWGHRVLLYEKSDFPRYRLGESLLPSTMPVLEDFGLLDKMEALGFPRKTGGSFTWGKQEEPWSVRFSENPFLPYPYAYHVDRSVFDAVLLDRAREAGVEVRRATVDEPVLDGDRVVGVRAHATGEPQHEELAPFVVDASGPASVLGDRLTLRTYDGGMRQTSLHTYYRGVAGEPAGQEGHVIVTSCEHGWFWYIPMSGGDLGEASVGLVTGQEFRPEIKELGAEGFFEKALSGAPRVQAMIGPRAERVGAVRGIKDWAFACGRMAGPGYFLAGDAAAFVDPLLSTGVTLAMLAGYSAAVCLSTALADPGMEADATAFYDTNYKRMYSVTRDCLMYFYSGNASREGVFWEARRLMRFGENAGAKQAFSHLVNTVAANPHPAARKQIHMFKQFMAHLEHPLGEMRKEPAFRLLMEEHGAPCLPLSALSDDTICRPNGSVSEACVIDDREHRLRKERGIAYDQDRPVFSSTASWLLGRNFAPLSGEAVELLQEAGEKGCTWSELVDRLSETWFMSRDEAEVEGLRVLGDLHREAFVRLHPPPAA